MANSDNIPLPWNAGIRDGYPLHVVVSLLYAHFALYF